MSAEIAETLAYRDPNTLYETNVTVGTVGQYAGSGDEVVLSGAIQPELVQQHGLQAVVALDGARRFVAAAAISDGAWSLRVRKAASGKDNAAKRLQVRAYGKSSDFAYRIVLSSNLDEHIAADIGAWLPEDSRDVPSLQSALEKVITDAVSVPYVARSVRDGIRTGNSYQTIALGEGRKTAGRQNRMDRLGAIDFRGKSVIDLGANTGEMSRSVRRLGAALVDGYEYDPYFVQIGRATNAAMGVTRVSLFQGDCTNPGLFRGMKYDYILALNVWVYISETIRDFPSISPVMIFETHTLDHGMNFYFDRVLPHYPHAACLGLTDLGEDPHKSRAFIIFTTRPEMIDRHASRQFIKVQPYFRNTFVNMHGPVGKREFWELAAQCHQLKHDAAAPAGSMEFGRDGYFERLLAGLHEFRAAGFRVLDDNVYMRFLTEAVATGLIDPKIRPVAENAAWMRRKVANKFEDMINILSGRPDHVPPLRMTRSETGDLHFQSLAGEDIRCSVIDGHHRFFSAQLAGLDKIHCEFT